MGAETVIYGCGQVSAVGSDTNEAWNCLQGDQLSGAVSLARPWFPEPFQAPCFQADSDETLQDHLRRSGIQAPSWVNRTVLLALKAILECCEMAGIELKTLREQRVGIALGTTVGCTFQSEAYYQQWRDGEVVDQTPFAAYLNHNLAAVIQRILGVRGPRAVVTNACSSGTDGIGIGSQWIREDLCDLVFAGGADELSRVACHGFHSLMLVSDDRCAPFGVHRKGLNLGEGAGILLLGADGDRAAPLFGEGIGRVRGYGGATDGYHPTAPHPEGRGLQRALRQALKQAGVSGRDLAMINGHGTGTIANDMAETNCLARLDLQSVPLVSTKGSTGHCLGAAGGIEAVFTLLCLRHGLLPGTRGCTRPDPDLGVQPLVQGEVRELHGRLGISQSLAFGGNNSALVLEAT